jgi:hypothetical protein
MKHLLPLLALVTALLTSCPDPREAVNFDTDLRVLRGSWNFVLSDVSSNAVVSTQAVVFTSTFVSDREYAVAASVTLNGEIYALTGTVYGAGVKFVRPQTSFLPPVSLSLTGQTTGKRYFASLGTPGRFEGLWKCGGRLNFVTADMNGTVEAYGLEIVRN